MSFIFVWTSLTDGQNSVQHYPHLSLVFVHEELLDEIIKNVPVGQLIKYNQRASKPDQWGLSSLIFLEVI